MCMEDIRIGRKTGPIANQFAPTAAADLKIADQNPRRIAIMIGIIGATAAIVAPAPLSPLNSQGQHLAQGEGMIILDVQHHGQIVTQQWNAVGVGGTSNVTVWESILNDE